MNNSENVPSYVIAACLDQFTDPEFRERFKKADVVTVVDENEQPHVFYGKGVFEAIAEGRGAEWDSVLWFVFNVDFRTKQPEYLAAAIEVLKGEGACCYPIAV